MTSSDFSGGVAPHFALQLIAGLTIVVVYRPPEISLVSVSAVITFRSPYAVEFFEAAFQILHLFHGLHQKVSGSALPFPYDDAAGFPSWYGLLSRTSFSEAYSASTPPVTRGHGELATWLSGDYHDRTSTGKLIQTFKTHYFRYGPMTRSPSLRWLCR